MILRAAELADGKSLAQELMYNIMEVKKNKAACVYGRQQDETEL
jgi:hypothetical protein